MAAVTADPDDPANRLLTTAEAAQAAHVTETRIRAWAHRGLIHPADHDPDGRPLYRELDILTTEATTRRTNRTQALAAQAAATLPNTHRA